MANFSNTYIQSKVYNHSYIERKKNGQKTKFCWPKRNVMWPLVTTATRISVCNWRLKDSCEYSFHTINLVGCLPIWWLLSLLSNWLHGCTVDGLICSLYSCLYVACLYIRDFVQLWFKYFSTLATMKGAQSWTNFQTSFSSMAFMLREKKKFLMFMCYLVFVLPKIFITIMYEVYKQTDL